MSEYQILAVIAAFGFLYSLVASRLERTPINGALVYIAFGLLCGPYFLGMMSPEVDAEGIKRLAELTLAIVLFSDSASANLGELRKVEQLPIRLLLIGLPLTIALGFGAGYLIFDGMSIFAIALLATMLAPTDAALGKAVVSNENVPVGVRQALNAESGLNDGICVPVLLIFLALTTTELGGSETVMMVVRLSLQQIGIGALAGVLLGIAGGTALRFCAKRDWVTGSWVQLPVIALALLCFAMAQWLGGSGFIASFVGGLIFGGITRDHKEEVLNGAEGTGDALSLITWVAFGAAVIGPQISHLNWRVFVYALLSLTIVRMLPVMLSLIGMKQRLDTQLFLGWFGPRGLASIVFAVMVAAENLAENETLVATVAWTIVLSIIAHGISANPLAKLYGDRVKARGGVT